MLKVLKQSIDDELDSIDDLISKRRSSYFTQYEEAIFNCFFTLGS
jgi:hypothetical protein